MKRILIPLNFSTTPVLYDSKQSFSASDESSGVLDFTTTADVTGTVASLTIRNSSENANRQTVLVDRIDVNSSPFSYTFAKPLSFGAYEGVILLKKNGVTVASATFLFGVNSSLSAEVLPSLVAAYSLDALVEEVETEIQNVKDAYSVTVSETIKGVNRTESTVQASENVRYLAEATRKSNELLRISQEAARVVAEEGRVTEFNALVDTAVIEQTVTQEVAEKYQQIEALNSTEMVSMRQQLEQKAEQAALAVERARIDNLSTMAEGSTTGDAELIDGRVGADAVTYPNIGASIRGQFGKVDIVSRKIMHLIEKDPLSTDDSSIINATIASGGRFLLDGDFEIGSSINVPSNTLIDFTPGSTVTLKSGANDYMFRNADMVNGNVNITIQNFSIYGNATLQTREYTGGAIAGYFGFGMFFYKVDGLYLTDGYVDKTNAWGIAHFSCINFKFKDIIFAQHAANGLNGDGITGTSSNGVIENISGYTSDDMIALSTGGGSLQGIPTGMPDVAVSDVKIKNIKCEKFGSVPSWIAVGLYATNNLPMSRIDIDNVKGYTESYLIRAGNYWPENPDGIFNDIKINDIERYNDANTRNDVVLYLFTAKFYRLRLSKIVNITTAAQTAHFIRVLDGLEIDTIFIDGVYIINNHPTAEIAFIKVDSASAKVTTVIANDILMLNAAGNVNDKVFSKIDNPNLTRLIGTNLKSPGTEIYCWTVNGKISATAQTARAISSRLTPQKGDFVVDGISFAPLYYNGTAWVSMT